MGSSYWVFIRLSRSGVRIATHTSDCTTRLTRAEKDEAFLSVGSILRVEQKKKHKRLFPVALTMFNLPKSTNTMSKVNYDSDKDGNGSRYSKTNKRDAEDEGGDSQPRGEQQGGGQNFEYLAGKTGTTRFVQVAKDSSRTRTRFVRILTTISIS